MSIVWAYLYAAFAGALANVLVGTNLRLFQGLQSPTLTAAVILLIGTGFSAVALVAWSAIAGLSLPSRADLAALPWWAWAGSGLQGVTVLAVFLTAGLSGAAMFSAPTVTGGAIFSLLLDHYGLVGFEQHSLNWSRVAGAVLLIGGTVLMAR